MRELRRCFVVALFIVTAAASFGHGQEVRPLERHWWWSRASMAEKILERAREFDLDTIILENDLRGTGWGDITGNLCDYSFSNQLRCEGQQLQLVRQLREDYARIIETARRNGVRTFVMCPEVHAPQAFGPLNFDDPKLWALIDDRLRNIFQALPGLAGYVLYLTEGPMVDVQNMKGSEPSNVVRARRLIETCWKACRAENRQLVVTTFIHSKAMLDAIAEALRGIPADPAISVLQYCCPNDWGLYALTNPSIGRVGPHAEVLGFDTCAENWGQGGHPFVQSPFMSNRLREARARGGNIAGICGYAAWTGHTALWTLNEANVYTCQMLIRRPDRDGQEILQEWCAKRFGERGAPVAAACLARTQPAVFKMEHIFGYWVDTTGKSGLPGLDEMDLYLIKDVFGEALTKWDPDAGLKATWSGIQHPDMKFVARVLEEKDQANRLCRQSLEEVRAAGEAFLPADRATLERAFSFQELWSRLWKSHVEAFFLRQIGRRDGWEKSLIARLETVLQNYEKQADELEARFGKDVFPSGPHRARAFIRDIRREIPGGEKAG